ncbi:AlkA N-terminal domain-containing protein [Salinicola sp. CPA57]|uniref:DNA-3-methyladenine glycosylase 2 family protein n=1 Tax=Salinicola sp. CPA57 TaxID=1949080 RepID=UPI000DA1A094|nr:AlkA N-terminal domain-containing protein [Salinicola sp. CPA57]
MLDPQQCRSARLARDARFDGRFFIAVSTTGIFCRPVCPATLPQERHVRYFESAVAASSAGYRPCLRCRPDSAPDSPAWIGSGTTLARAIGLIDGGALQNGDVTQLCERLGIGERYLRQLFQRRFGVSPKAYSLYRQCLFAKKLLHETTLPVIDVAHASGFSSLRRFNDAFKRQMSLTPTDIRRRRSRKNAALTLKLAYRPPYQWERLRHFFAVHVIEGLEWVGEQSIGRTIRYGATTGHFEARHDAERHQFEVTLVLNELGELNAIVRQIRRMLDLDADTQTIEAHLGQCVPELTLAEGLRLPGSWNVFESGIRAVLGQQISIAAANRLIQQLVDQLGERAGNKRRHFPAASVIAASDLSFLKLPGSRRETVRRLAVAYASGEVGDDPQQWLTLKGIGPWTANVAAFRGNADPDIWLDGDVGVRRALATLSTSIDPALASPWRSYLTLQLWNRIL